MTDSALGQKLKPIGDVINVDDEGYLIKTVSKETIEPGMIELLSRIVEIAKGVYNTNLHSLYVRGSVAKGSFIPNISDIDPIIVIKNEGSDAEFEDIKSKLIDLNKQHSDVTNIEKNVQTVSIFVDKKSPIHRYQTVCVYGKDLAPQMQKLKIGKETVVHLPRIIQSIDENLPRIEGETEPKWVKHWSVWMCKQLIRSAHELVAEELGRFARDIYPCYEGAAKVYPDSESLLRHTAEIAVFGTTDKVELIKVTEDMRAFLEPKIKDFYK